MKTEVMNDENENTVLNIYNIQFNDYGKDLPAGGVNEICPEVEVYITKL